MKYFTATEREKYDACFSTLGLVVHAGYTTFRYAEVGLSPNLTFKKESPCRLLHREIPQDNGI
jgi:hypothetical protein